jgi:nucleoside-triphosphatase THEP1
MSNIFLTGERGIGKSTLAEKLIAKSGLKAAGLKTLFKEKRDEPHACLYACRWDAKPVFDENHIIARFGSTYPEALTYRFNALCAEMINEAVENEKVQLIIIDELGFLERDALSFKSAVIRAVECPKPVIAVIRKGLPGWTAEVSGKEPGDLYEVTVENRNDLLTVLHNKLITEK